MQATFQVVANRSTKHKERKFDRTITLEVDRDGIHCQYGYFRENEEEVKTFVRKHHTYTVCPDTKYVIQRYVYPMPGDVLVHLASGRKFIVGKRSGYVCYTADLLEDGKPVATIFFEDYYKD